MSDVRSCRTSWYILDSADLAVREYCFHSNDHIFNSAIQGRELSDTSCSNQSAHLRKRLGLWGMSCRKSSFSEHVIQFLKRYAALAGNLHVVLIYLDYFIHSRAVDYDRILKGCLKSALDRGVSCPWHYVNFIIISEFQHF